MCTDRSPFERAIPEALLVFVRRRPETNSAGAWSPGPPMTPKAIERRLARADSEEQIAQEKFDAVIVNDDIERAIAELAAIVESRRNGAH